MKSNPAFHPAFSCASAVTPGIYIHIPFCMRKCPYCDFNSYTAAGRDIDAYVQALLLEMRLVKNSLSHNLPTFGSVYFGGGTPTVLPASNLISILDSIRSFFPISSDAEITVEANPGTVSPESLAQLRSAGFNRLSLGVQSLENRFLRALGRIHTAEQAMESFVWARRAGFTNISIDLIYALPGQSIDDWRADLGCALNLHPEHISAYALTIEPGTPFWRRREKGKLQLPNEDEELEMERLAEGMLCSGGYERYEVSNYAKPGYRSRHNQMYWRNWPYLGFGAGAASYWDGERRINIKQPSAYARVVGRGRLPVAEAERLPPLKAAGEMLMLGLRMLEGIDSADVKRRFGVDVLSAFASEVERMKTLGLLQVDGTRLKLTPRGLLLANEVCAAFIV
ncbi:MAG: radical SAM family heme chaperone HemW [Armatimonadota bacterium]